MIDKPEIEKPTLVYLSTMNYRYNHIDISRVHGKYILVYCRYSDSPNNHRMFMVDISTEFY